MNEQNNKIHVYATEVLKGLSSFLY